MQLRLITLFSVEKSRAAKVAPWARDGVRAAAIITKHTIILQESLFIWRGFASRNQNPACDYPKISSMMRYRDVLDAAFGVAGGGAASHDR